MRNLLKVLLLAALPMFSLSTMASTQVWTLDPSHSSIGFTIEHMKISETTGKFAEYTADVTADKNDFTDAQFKVEIKVASIDTADEKRDTHLKGKDFFNTDVNPNITFVGKKFTKLKNGKYKVVGTLTMNGVSKEETLDAKFNGIQKDPWGNTRAGLKVWGKLDRYAYNLKYNSVLETGAIAIGQDVEIAANLELIKKVEAVKK